ncbi:preprotein translocase subunit SecG [Nocardia amikacinitolerans]|uniref:Protein-export membrane protein SecG n=3 Tax=Nocardia TaxID=1817 RepID=A0A285L5J7_9NOCA|nr:preprotein translocase subunit SecG [Nocardia amikacinitolerans]MCP2288002.1 preprotein translocase subunit SecG [Nocardia amikacinitolerans]MCP2299804.1 preprotein translocase subunit SecG [Nocardia amikacinitolerans]MCP2315758.1 preprotein translocase subunit SecG [Nocardia amikacinitolerans]SNY80220.1 preprotein translocase subunit SecG [Nocardia amikacinitolerans]
MAPHRLVAMRMFLDILLIITSLLLVLLVLLHRAKGGGLSSLFGGGVQSSLSGSTVVEKNLDRVTIFTGVIWVIAILGIGLEIKFA